MASSRKKGDRLSYGFYRVFDRDLSPDKRLKLMERFLLFHKRRDLEDILHNTLLKLLEKGYPIHNLREELEKMIEQAEDYPDARNIVNELLKRLDETLENMYLEDVVKQRVEEWKIRNGESY